MPRLLFRVQHQLPERGESGRAHLFGGQEPQYYRGSLLIPFHDVSTTTAWPGGCLPASSRWRIPISYRPDQRRGDRAADLVDEEHGARLASAGQSGRIALSRRVAPAG